MSDFLARLAGRALGITPTVKPVIDPAFAAFPSTGSQGYSSGAAAPDVDRGATVVTAVTPARRERELDDSPAAPVGRLVQDDVQLRDEGFERIEPLLTRVEHVAALSTDAAAAHQEIIFDDALPPRAIAIAPAGHLEDIPPPVSSAMTARNTLPESGEKTSYGLIPAPRSFALRPQRHFQPQAADAAEPPEVVRITIGRIDVRAEFPPPPPARAASREPENRGLSLDDYLKQRAEGRR
jgi:hypothetical protein